MLASESGYFGCDFVDNKVANTYYFAPAAVAGIKVGDLIVAIDKQTVTAANSQKTLGKLQGVPGSTVTVTVMRKGKRLTFLIRRDSLPRPEFVKHSSAQEYYVDGMRQLDCGYIPTARLNLEEAESMGYKPAATALKTLLPKNDPTRDEMNLLGTIRSALKNKQLALAQKLCDAALKNYPDSETVLLLSAYCQRQRGMYKQALVSAQKLRQLNANYQPGLIETAYCLALNGSIEQAQSTLQEAASINRNGDQLSALADYLKSTTKPHHR